MQIMFNKIAHIYQKKRCVNYKTGLFLSKPGKIHVDCRAEKKMPAGF
jgi:hypothetical protein